MKEAKKPMARMMHNKTIEPNYNPKTNNHGIFKRIEKYTRFDNVVDDAARQKVFENSQQSE